MGLGSNEVCGDGLHRSHQKLLKNGNVEEIRKRKEEEDKQMIVAGPALTPLRCPRCDSENTKFCYYNNYSRSQPRHFCKSCRRHWTNGGTLRSVPVGGSRKNKRPKISHPASTNMPGKDQIFENDNIGIDMKQSKHQPRQKDELHDQHIQPDQLLHQFVPDLALPHPLTPSSSSSDYSSSTTGMIGRNGSRALGSLLSSLPPTLNPLLLDPFFLANNSSVLPLSQPQSTSGFLSLMELMGETVDDQEDYRFGLTNSSSLVDCEIAKPKSTTVSWQSSADLLPMCSSNLANISKGLELSSTEGGSFWNYLDEPTGFATPPTAASHGFP